MDKTKKLAISVSIIQMIAGVITVVLALLYLFGVVNFQLSIVIMFVVITCLITIINFVIQVRRQK